LAYGFYKGGPKRLVAGVVFLITLGLIAFYSIDVKGDMLFKFTESFSMIRDQGYTMMVGQLPPHLKGIPKRKKKGGKKK